MVDELQLFRETILGIDHKISDNITIKNRTIGEICEFGENHYYNMVSLLCSTSSQHKVELWDAGTDWTTIGDWEFFLILFNQLKQEDISFIVDIDNFNKLSIMKNLQNNQLVIGFIDGNESKIVIDRMFHYEMCEYLRKMHGFTKDEREPSNEYSKKKMIEKERKAKKRQQEQVKRGEFRQESMLKPLIASLVNHQSFKYTYENVWDITISALTESTNRIQKYNNYTQIMQGVYAGTVDLEKMKDKDCLNWLN